MDRVHLTAFTMRNFMHEHEWDEKFKFAFVRNPWDRVVSQYHHRLGVNQQNIRSKGITFNDWVIEVYHKKNTEYRNFNSMFLPQKDWLSDMNGNIIVDYIGRFENLDEDLEFIKNKLGIEKSTPHLRASKRAKYQEYYNKETRDIVAQYFSKDIEHFNYSF